jgi:hypothetical protein
MIWVGSSATHTLWIGFGSGREPSGSAPSQLVACRAGICREAMSSASCSLFRDALCLRTRASLSRARAAALASAVVCGGGASAASAAAAFAAGGASAGTSASSVLWSPTSVVASFLEHLLAGDLAVVMQDWLWEALRLMLQVEPEVASQPEAAGPRLRLQPGVRSCKLAVPETGTHGCFSCLPDLAASARRLCCADRQRLQ